ncbi:MAG TPA: hypothetical protein VFX85_00725 [Solirubrobacterales bacterium]|nr:hypothetical protein [Solirubrobacterales bacterium]
MHRIKTFGVALIAMMAMGAVAASLASANEFTATEYPVTLTGFDEAGFAPVFTTTAGTVQCPTATYHATVEKATTSVPVTPTYSGCTAFGFPAVIDLNGCTYKFNIGAGETTEGTADLVCPAGKEITVTAISAGIVKCTVHVAPQTGLGSLKYTNILTKETDPPSTEEITIDVTLQKIKYSHTQGTGLGSCPSGAGEGSLGGKVVVTGERDIPNNGEHIGIRLSIA